MEFVEENGIGFFRSEKMFERGIKHGFTTKIMRDFSNPLFPSKPHNIDRNQLAKFSLKMGLDSCHFVFQEQVHDNQVSIIKAENLSINALTIIPQNDGLITNLKNVCLVSLSADCLCILLAHPKSGAIATAHAGRRGALKGIISKLVWMYCVEYQLSPSEILVALGTSILAPCYEVKYDVVEEIKMTDPDALGFLIKRDEKRFFDLRGYILRSLFMAGINPDNIDSQGKCSHCRDDLFYSYRRDGSVIGSMAAFIAT